MATYPRKLTPAQLILAKENRDRIREKKKEQLKDYARRWKDPLTKPAMLLRSKDGRDCVEGNKRARMEAFRKFLAVSPSKLTRAEWLAALHNGQYRIQMTLDNVRGRNKINMRSLSPEHMFRTIIRWGLIKHDLTLNAYVNPHRR